MNVLASQGDGVNPYSKITREVKRKKLGAWLSKSEGHGTKETSQIIGMRRLRVVSAYVIRQVYKKVAGTEILEEEYNMGSPNSKSLKSGKNANATSPSRSPLKSPEVSKYNQQSGMISPQSQDK